jgi:MFS family permease
MHFVLIILFALYGLYSASTDGVQKALVSDLIDDDKRGTGLGLYNAVLGITLLPASLIGGILYQYVSSSAAFYFGAVMAFAAMVMMVIFYRKRIGIAKQ